MTRYKHPKDGTDKPDSMYFIFAFDFVKKPDDHPLKKEDDEKLKGNKGVIKLFKFNNRNFEFKQEF